MRHSYATAGRDAKIDWKALSQRIGHADVAFTMKQYVQTDLEADRQVANTLAELIIGGSLVSTEIDDRGGRHERRVHERDARSANPLHKPQARGPLPVRNRASDFRSGGQDLNLRPLGYEPSEATQLLHPASVSLTL